MTPTAIELWNSKEFIEKRLHEQLCYVVWLQQERLKGKIRIERYAELRDSAQCVEYRFHTRLQELNQQ